MKSSVFNPVRKNKAGKYILQLLGHALRSRILLYSGVKIEFNVKKS